MVRSIAPSLVLVLSLANLSLAADVEVPLHTSDINTALLMAGPGGTVTVAGDTYYQNVSIPFSNQTLRADGKVTIDGGGSNVGITVASGATGVKIEDMRVRNCSTGINILGDNATVDGCQVRLTSFYGILLSTSDNTTIEHTKIKDTGSHGVYGFMSDNCVIEKCSIKRSGEAGIYLLGNVNSILDNKIADTGTHGIQLGTDITAASGNLIEDNDISAAHSDAIACYALSSNSTIQENVIHGATFDGIDIAITSNGHTLFKNKIYTSGDNGIEVGGDNCTVSQNKCWQSQSDGIRVEAGSNNSLYFKNVSKFSQAYGIAVSGTSNNFTQNKMKLNLLLDRYSAVALAANIWLNNKFNTSNL
ncbi:MAG: right-handed parallel beta-helix repeat-containing protein [Planctomycetota bacterium]